MHPPRWYSVATALIAVTVSVSALGAQDATYHARLFPLPVDANTQATTTGGGSVSATLKGATLTITGTFAGLQKPATVGRIHVGPRGIRGPAALELVVMKATSGTVQGELLLSTAQVDHLKRGRLYVQIHSEAAPDGNLWGWLLP